MLLLAAHLLALLLVEASQFPDRFTNFLPPGLPHPPEVTNFLGRRFQEPPPRTLLFPALQAFLLPLYGEKLNPPEARFLLEISRELEFNSLGFFSSEEEDRTPENLISEDSEEEVVSSLLSRSVNPRGERSGISSDLPGIPNLFPAYVAIALIEVEVEWRKRGLTHSLLGRKHRALGMKTGVLGFFVKHVGRKLGSLARSVENLSDHASYELRFRMWKMLVRTQNFSFRRSNRPLSLESGTLRVLRTVFSEIWMPHVTLLEE